MSAKIDIFYNREAYAYFELMQSTRLIHISQNFLRTITDLKRYNLQVFENERLEIINEYELIRQEMKRQEISTADLERKFIELLN